MEDATWSQVERTFECIKWELGNPPIMLVRPSEYEQLTGLSLGHYTGRIHFKRRLITVRYRDRELIDINKTIYHEIAHILFPHKPHWWIECFAAKKSGSKITGRYSVRYGHSIEELPSRSELSRLAWEASDRLKAEVGRIILRERHQSLTEKQQQELLERGIIS